MVIIFDGSQNQCEYAYRLRTGESGTEKPTKITAVLSGSSKFYLILTQHPKHHIHIPSKYSPSTIDLSKQMLSMKIVTMIKFYRKASPRTYCN